MNPKKINPDNPLVKQMDQSGMWSKMCAILVDRFGEVLNTSDGHRHCVVKIDSKDLQKFESNYSGEMPTIVIQEIDGKLTLVVEPESDATARAKRGGYL